MSEAKCWHRDPSACKCAEKAEIASLKAELETANEKVTNVVKMLTVAHEDRDKLKGRAEAAESRVAELEGPAAWASTDPGSGSRRVISELHMERDAYAARCAELERAVEAYRSGIEKMDSLFRRGAASSKHRPILSRLIELAASSHDRVDSDHCRLAKHRWNEDGECANAGCEATAYSSAPAPQIAGEAKCVCGESSPDRIVVHRKDGPCYLRPQPQAEPGSVREAAQRHGIEPKEDEQGQQVIDRMTGVRTPAPAPSAAEVEHSFTLPYGPGSRCNRCGSSSGDGWCKPAESGEATKP